MGNLFNTCSRLSISYNVLQMFSYEQIFQKQLYLLFTDAIYRSNRALPFTQWGSDAVLWQFFAIMEENIITTFEFNIYSILLWISFSYFKSKYLQKFNLNNISFWCPTMCWSWFFFFYIFEIHAHLFFCAIKQHAYKPAEY